jgi:hypothetical protein
MQQFKQDYTVRGPRSRPFTIMSTNSTVHVGLILIQRIGIKIRANSSSLAGYYKTSGTSTCMTHSPSFTFLEGSFSEVHTLVTACMVIIFSSTSITERLADAKLKLLKAQSALFCLLKSINFDQSEHPHDFNI